MSFASNVTAVIRQVVESSEGVKTSAQALLDLVHSSQIEPELKSKMLEQFAVMVPHLSTLTGMSRDLAKVINPPESQEIKAGDVGDLHKVLG